MPEVLIVSAVRTPIGQIRGALSQVRPDDLAALVIREAVSRADVDAAQIEEVYMGCANQAGEDNRNVARMALLLAGLPQSVPGATVNRLCASGLTAINQAARAIRAGEGEIYVAGGVESMTRAPYVLSKNPQAFGPSGNITGYDSTLGWRFPNPKMKSLFPLEAMGINPSDLAIILTAEAGAAFQELTLSGRDDELVRQVRYAWPNVFRTAQFIPAVEYIQANRHRTRLMEMMTELFREIDVYLTPSLAGDSLLITNLTGHPQVVVPAGFVDEDSPHSLSFVGDLYDEATLLAVARTFQEITSWHKKTPPGY